MKKGKNNAAEQYRLSQASELLKSIDMRNQKKYMVRIKLNDHPAIMTGIVTLDKNNKIEKSFTNKPEMCFVITAVSNEEAQKILWANLKIILCETKQRSLGKQTKA